MAKYNGGGAMVNQNNRQPPTNTKAAYTGWIPLPKGYCHFFIKRGVCQNDKCRFKHEIPPSVQQAIQQQANLGDLEDVDECEKFITEGSCDRFRTCPHFHPEVECDVWVEYGNCKKKEAGRCPLQHRSRWKKPNVQSPVGDTQSNQNQHALASSSKAPNPAPNTRSQPFRIVTEDTLNKLRVVIREPAPLDELASRFQKIHGERLLGGMSSVTEIEELIQTLHRDFEIIQEGYRKYVRTRGGETKKRRQRSRDRSTPSSRSRDRGRSRRRRRERSRSRS